jgi:hypothetical protein
MKTTTSTIKLRKRRRVLGERRGERRGEERRCKKKKF